MSSLFNRKWGLGFVNQDHTLLVFTSWSSLTSVQTNQLCSKIYSFEQWKTIIPTKVQWDLKYSFGYILWNCVLTELSTILCSQLLSFGDISLFGSIRWHSFLRFPGIPLGFTLEVQHTGASYSTKIPIIYLNMPTLMLTNNFLTCVYISNGSLLKQSVNFLELFVTRSRREIFDVFGSFVESLFRLRTVKR